MKRQLPILLAILFAASACGKTPPAIPTSTPSPPPTDTPSPTALPTDIPLPTLTPACISSEPTQDDIERALSYAGGVFDTPEWDMTHSVMEDHVSVTRQSVIQGAVAYLEARIFPCGYEEPDLNKYYNDENWKIVFQNYESYELSIQCRLDTGLRLYQFKAQNFGFEYDARYWVQNDTDTRVIVTMLVFPIVPGSLIDEYASQLFPSLPNCS
ncbi:MAG: hypothetical protein HYZ23_03015 [Chloroflexi bacterium]|nr:hypothetical protein [Chloroflexota bacterium]